ncbi:MAG: hypothetical protein GX208_04825 [Firmicutes bacterium]|nr:hypothetical protein [Bacillota bacterium]
MRRFGLLVVFIVLVIGVGLIYLNFCVTSPLAVAEAYLNALEKGDFQQAAVYFHSKPFAPTAAKLTDAFDKFAAAFGLTKIELLDLVPIREKVHQAEYNFTIKYTSKFFEPIVIQNQLRLAWDGVFKWKVIWQDNLPLPAYGLSASYSRTRLESGRGNLYDRNGQLLAGIGSYITIGVQPDRIQDSEQLLAAFEEVLGLSPDYVQQLYQAPGVQGHWFVPIISVSERKYQEVDPILRPIPGVFFRREEIRGYPYGEVLGHITGYLGEVTPQMLEQFTERDYRVGEIVGRSGLEYSLEPQLRGRPGYHFYVYPVAGARELLAERQVVEGQDLYLTIDVQLQELAYKLLQQHQAGFVLLNATTGEVLVLVSTPSYDPNELVIGISSQRWQELSNDPALPLVNRALQGLYPLDSVLPETIIEEVLNQEAKLYLPAKAGQLGQGQLLLNPFQLASTVAALANDGKLPRFYLLRNDQEQPIIQDSASSKNVNSVTLEGENHIWHGGIVNKGDQTLAFAILVENADIDGHATKQLVRQFFLQAGISN